jgi:hypothetical protein
LAPQKDRRVLKGKMPADGANATLAPDADLGWSAVRNRAAS